MNLRKSWLPIPPPPINAELYVLFILFLSSLLILLCGPGCAMCPPGLVTNKPCFFQSSWVVVDKVHLAVGKRTTRAGAATIQVPVGGNICGYATNSTGPHEYPTPAFLADQMG